MQRTRWDFLTGDRQKDQRNVEVLLESVEAFYGPRSLGDLVRSAVDRAILVTGAERGILLLAGADGDLVPHTARRAGEVDLPLDGPYSTTVVRKVWESGEPFVTMDVADSHAIAMGESIPAMRLLSVMGVPMPVVGKSIGVLYVDSTQAVKSFTPVELSIFQALGGLIAMAVENAQLLAEREEQERMKRDLQVARRVQEGFLPASLPQPEGFQIAGIGRPCEETSGDYYDVIPIGGERYALVVGDVSDHGLGPALVMASTRALLHATLASRTEPLEVIRSVNAFLERDTPPELFMTMFLGTLDPRTRGLQYVSAGHNAPLVLSPDGTLTELPRTGCPLGVLANAPYRVSETLTLGPGTTVMLFTDGVFEAFNPNEEMYGEERMRASFRRHAAGASSAQDVVEGVLHDLRTFVQGRPLQDDVTCMIVRAM